MSFWSNAPLGLFIFHNIFRNVNIYNINSSDSCYNSSMRYLSYENVYVVKGLCVGLGDEVEEVGPADCELQTVSGALECPHHTGWAQPEGERPHPLPPDGQECGGEVRGHTHTHTHRHCQRGFNFYLLCTFAGAASSFQFCCLWLIFKRILNMPSGLNI